MVSREEWPFTPIKLSEIIDPATLAVIEAGCCERLGRAMTIIDAGQPAEHAGRFDSFNERQRFEAFCACFRDESRVRGGNDACEKCDRIAAQRALKKTNHDLCRIFKCHLGLLDATCVIRIRDRPVAVLFSGQYRPPEGIEQIQRNVRNLRAERYAHIELLDQTVEPELLALAAALPSPPPDFMERLKREAEHIQRIAEAEYQRLKNLWEQEFLDKLRALAGCSETASLTQLRHCTGYLLELIQIFCHCDYVIFFASIQEADTVLAPIAEVGLPAALKKKLPHFNWKKAGLSLANAQIKNWNINEGMKTALKGIRGDNSDYFDRAGCLLPTMLSNRYCGVLVFGPFAEPINLAKERRFLSEMTNIIGSFVLTELQILHLEQERRRWESTAKLLIHQLRTALTPITTQIGSAKLFLRGAGKDSAVTKNVLEALQRAEELCLRLGRSARETLRSHVLLLEAEDLKFESYPLSVLVANCIESFGPEAEKRRRQLIVDKSIELLPEAEVDVARLTIALSNLVENALKYSYPHTKIHVRAFVQAAGDLELATAVIEIDDLGDEIRPADQERIFEQGVRGMAGVKMGRIPGTGLGLWEARAVIEAHSGTLTVRSEPTSIHRAQGQAYRVVFSVIVPLRQLR